MLLQIGCAWCLRNLVQEKVISGGFVLEAISYLEEEEEPIGGLFLSIYYDLPLAKATAADYATDSFCKR